MAKTPKEVGRIKLEENGWEYVINNSLRGVDGSLLFLEYTDAFLFAFGSIWVVDTGVYDDTAPLPGQTLSSVYRLLRIDPTTKSVVAIIPLPGRLRFRSAGPSHDHQSYHGLALCEGAGKVWLAFGSGGKGPWSNGDSNDVAQSLIETNPSNPYARGVVISVSPTDNLVKTINPLDNIVESPQIVFGGGFIWVSQSNRWQDDATLRSCHGFAQEFWSPLLRIDPSSSYSPPVFGLMSPDLMPCHPTLRVFPNLWEYPFPAFDSINDNSEAFNISIPTTRPPPSSFQIRKMLSADGYLIINTYFTVLDTRSGGYQSGNYYPYSLFRTSRLNTSNLETKKGPSFSASYNNEFFYQIIWVEKTKSIWVASGNYDEDYEQLLSEIWVGDIDLNFTKAPIALGSWLSVSPPYGYDTTASVPEGYPSLINFVYGLAFDGVEVFASTITISGHDLSAESVTLRINPKSKTLKSTITFEMPPQQQDDTWYRGVPLYILHAEDGLFWVTTGTLVFPIKQGRFGGWKVGKI